MANKAPRAGGDTSVAGVVVRVAAALLAVALLVLGFVALHYQAWIDRPLLRAYESRTVVVPKGASWDDTVAILERAGLIDRPTYFEFWARRRHLPSQVKAGTFELDGPVDLDRLAERLRQGGQVAETQLTLPEGLTIFHMADRIEEAGLADRAEFLRAVRDPELLEAAGLEADSFEGYLFPDTYRFRKGTSADRIVRRLHKRWREVWAEVEAEHREGFDQLAADYGFDRHDVVTLASLVERESGVGSERPLIARVFLNRLDRDMRLQTDPTCVYGEETYDQVPRPKHCKDPLNRYSTYVIDGLPPGPIANPGRASLSAALAPATGEEARQFLFFVARRDGSGGHHFTKTFREHKRAIRKYLR